MMAAPPREIIYNKKKPFFLRRNVERIALSKSENAPETVVFTFADRLKKTLGVLKWLKELMITLAWLKGVVAFVVSLVFIYLSSSPTKPLSELFPQATAGRQFLWAHPDQSVKAGFDSRCAKPKLKNGFGFFGASSGLQIQYGVAPDMQQGGWGVHWDHAPTQSFDASGFDHFSFWVRGVSGDESFEIGLKDTSARETKIESKDWIATRALRNGVEVIIPLAEFGDVNKKSLNNISFSFNALHGSGTLCIDNIAFGGRTRA
ncbi:MAG TPA: hypothetical protein P5102_15780 [Candidatus Competibacteraceae bacterium]|nr:hypothetical protein [Candidatus Competibacteraceae bacterium]